MASEIEFDDAEVKRFLNKVVELAQDPEKSKEIVGAFSAVVFKDVIDHFKDEQGATGDWDPWSTVYAQHMARIGRSNNKILQFNGRLRQNFKPQNYRPGNDAITWFNDAKTKSGYAYAWGHDTGDGKLPQREFMYLGKKGLDTIAAIVWDKILAEAEGAV